MVLLVVPLFPTFSPDFYLFSFVSFSLCLCESISTVLLNYYVFMSKCNLLSM